MYKIARNSYAFALRVIGVLQVIVAVVGVIMVVGVLFSDFSLGGGYGNTGFGPRLGVAAVVGLLFSIYFVSLVAIRAVIENAIVSSESRDLLEQMNNRR